MPDFKARQKKLRALMEKAGLDAVLATDEKDVFYYTGHMPSERAFLHLTPSHVKLFASGLDNEAEKKVKDVVFFRKLKEVASRLYGKVGVDYSVPAGTLLELRRLAKKAKLRDAGKLMKEPRSVKDKEEVGKIREAVRLSNAVLGSARPWGKAERDVANRIEIEFLKRGARRAYPVIVAAGANSYFVHHAPGRSRIKEDPVIMDAGAKVNDYCSDVTRTLLKGQDRRRKKLLEDAKGMQAEIIGFIEPGKKFGEVQRFWEGLMKRKGYKVFHAFGHGIGLDVHEPVDVIKEGSVLTVEPGIYTRRYGGYRIEDVVTIRKGKAKILA
jgi:Xaa-Pro aminopeptidase